MPRTAALASLLLALLGACASSGSTDVPGDLVDIPWPDDPLDARVAGARRSGERGDEAGALATVEAVLADAPRHVDGQRLRQDLLRDRGRLGRVLAESEQRIVEWDDSAEAHYLRGRVVPDWEQKRLSFAAALERRPELFWAWLGTAFVERRENPDRALDIYRQLYEESEGLPLVAVAFGQTLRILDRRPDALAVYNELRRHDEVAPGVGSLGLAETFLANDQRREAWAPLMDALQQRPWDSGVRRMLEAYVSRGLADSEVEQVLAMLWEDPERYADFLAGGGAGVTAALLQRAALDAQAREVMRGEFAPRTADARRQARRLMLGGGDVPGFLEELDREFPRSMFEDEGNQQRGLWANLLRGPWRDAEDPLADLAMALGLGEAMRDTGLLFEAQLLSTLALARHPEAEPIRELRIEVQRELAFESGLRRVLYSGYVGGRFDLDGFLGHVRKLSLRVLGEDVVGEPEFFQVPMVGRLVDPFGPGLPGHLARYNKHLVLGQRDGMPPEGLLLTRLSTRFIEPSADLPLAGRCWQVVGEDRQVQSLQGVLGGDLAGVALLNHYVIDMDAVRDWGDSLRRRREIVREDEGALLDDPLPDQVDPLDPVDVNWRLTCLSPVEDSELDQAVFEMVCLHERAHLVDSFRYLPPESNLWRVMGLVISQGFSAFSIESEMEGRAETAALAYGDHPRLVLAHIASFIDGGVEGSPHAEGFQRLAQALNEKMAADPELAEFARVSRWHLAPPDAVERLAREVADGYWH